MKQRIHTDRIACTLFRLNGGANYFNTVDGSFRVHVHSGGASLISHGCVTCERVSNIPINFSCTCDPALASTDRVAERYAQQVLMQLPEGRERTRRVAEGLSTQVSVDPCITEVIKYLWSQGIETLGCCCGHNTWPALVDVFDDQFDKMYALGYKKFPMNEHGHGHGSFLLK